jgi:hypothetical protein
MAIKKKKKAAAGHSDLVKLRGWKKNNYTMGSKDKKKRIGDVKNSASVFQQDYEQGVRGSLHDNYWY